MALARQLQLASTPWPPFTDVPGKPRFALELVGMMVDGSYHNHLGLHWIRADVDGDGRTEYVPRGDRMGSRPSEEAYLLFTPPSASPIIGVSTARRFYFGGNVHEGWSSVPGGF